MIEPTKRIRAFINEPRRQHQLLKNREFWLQLCSSLDVIQDSENAIDAYSLGGFGTSVGVQYLAAYGLLQALFLQQDAVFNLCESLQIPETIRNYPSLLEIRNVRNDSIGHPTKRDKPKSQPKSYHFISQASIDHGGFTLLSYYDGFVPHFRKISTIKLISDQKEYVLSILSSVVAKLELEESAHKEQFKVEKLADVFPETMTYYFEKIFEGIHRTDYAELSKGVLELVKNVLDDMSAALKKRGIEIETYDSIKYIYELLEYPMDQLKRFYEEAEQTDRSINAKTAYIFAFFIRAQFDDLEKIAMSIDAEYSQ